MANLQPAPAAVEELVARLAAVRADWNGADIPAAELPSFRVLCETLAEAATALSTLAADKARMEAVAEREKSHALSVLEGARLSVEAAEARATSAEVERDAARAELDDGMRDYDGGYEAGQSDVANAVEATEARASALEEALVKIERLGSDGEHSGDRHAQCRAIAQSALAASQGER